ncbi:hypothetical protein Cob_v000958 [Colletotrichum orbiculare MAFF 240422]|uniref:Uncharacterized protein n=1 Tax=Colletotrichum orbiculare (strain 104-T / ATCC 96160 / CBS 514.97 / LARS 414 / MAFF 240422) TaxID=1213857 RepID=A0A484G8V3_COLOR|nr:hypothetical protein Cob_v000958 [Colletotrichum orbiculare MAFF 240422]
MGRPITEAKGSPRALGYKYAKQAALTSGYHQICKPTKAWLWIDAIDYNPGEARPGLAKSREDWQVKPSCGKVADVYLSGVCFRVVSQLAINHNLALVWSLHPWSLASPSPYRTDCPVYRLGAGWTFRLPTFGGQEFGPMVATPPDDLDYDLEDLEEADPDVLPPTTSTYIHRDKPVPKPPTIEELKADLTESLQKAATALKDAKNNKKNAQAEAEAAASQNTSKKPTGWFEVQGMHILDVMTLAIRAAKNYYTAHEVPERLDAIKSEKEIRTELFNVLETLKQMATRKWAGGMKEEEYSTLNSWIQGLFSMLKTEAEMIEAEEAERRSWTWLKGDWTGKEVERELAFLASLAPRSDPLTGYSPASGAADGQTPFLQSLQNGILLVELHNAAVKRSKRRFGLITTFHNDTEKPYRAADNLRFWAKAAELRWEVLLKVDALGIVYNSSPEVWVNFEQAIFAWSRKVREEITSELGS